MTIPELQSTVDIVIIAVRTDEFRAIQKQFPRIERASGRQEYHVSRVNRDDQEECVVALVKSPEGPLAAQATMKDIIADLAPDLTLTVGIGGAIPQDAEALTLGDVVVSSGLLDVMRKELLPSEKAETKPRPFPLHERARKIVENIQVDPGWSSKDQVGVLRPSSTVPGTPKQGCPADWELRAQASLRQAVERDEPLLHIGTVASGPDFVKDPVAVKEWQKKTKKYRDERVLSSLLFATEMESVGVHHASVEDNRHFNWISIRGISDIIGLQRDKAWDAYACAVSAAFALAFVKSLRAQPRKRQIDLSVFPPKRDGEPNPGPPGAFQRLNFSGAPALVEVLALKPVAPATAVLLSSNAVGVRAFSLAKQQHFIMIVGTSGSGKSTLALGVTGQFAATEGRTVYRYQPPTGHPSREAVEELLQACAEMRDGVILIDDINTWASADDIARLAAAASDRAIIVTTITSQSSDETIRSELHLSTNRIDLNWEVLRSSVIQLFNEHEVEVVDWLRQHRPPDDGRSVGYEDVLGHSLESLTRRYAEQSKTVWQFLFLLRGGWSAIRADLQRLVDKGRADIPVLYAAIEQIAAVERPVTPDEVASAIRAIRVAGLPVADPRWIQESFEEMVRRRLMTPARNAYTTAHRDWARALISTALSEQLSRGAALELLARDFRVDTPYPRRLMILWSWFDYDTGGAGQFAYDFRRSNRNSDWSILIGNAAASSLLDVALVAGRLHMCYRDIYWERDLGHAFEPHEEVLASLVAVAGPADWSHLRELFMALDRCNSALAARVVSQWAPETAAAALEATDPTYYFSVQSTLGGIFQYSPDWVRALARNLSWERIDTQFEHIRPGAVDTLMRFVSVLEQLGMPLLRSRLRRITSTLTRVLAHASLSEIDFDDVIMLVQLEYFPDEMRRVVEGMNIQEFARQLVQAPPRHWGKLLTLTIYAVRAGVPLGEELVAAMDLEAFVKNVSKYRDQPPRLWRQLLWQLAYGSAKERSSLAMRINDDIKYVAGRSSTERPEILRALFAIDRSLGEQMAQDLGVPLPSERTVLDVPLRPLSEAHPQGMAIVQKLRELDQEEVDYDVNQEIESIIKRESHPSPAKHVDAESEREEVNHDGAPGSLTKPMEVMKAGADHLSAPVRRRYILIFLLALGGAGLLGALLQWLVTAVRR